MEGTQPRCRLLQGKGDSNKWEVIFSKPILEVADIFCLKKNQILWMGLPSFQKFLFLFDLGA